MLIYFQKDKKQKNKKIKKQKKGWKLIMDFSSKQALGVVVVVGVAALVIGAAILLTNTNNKNTTNSSNKMWNQTNDLVEKNMNQAGNNALEK